MVDTPYRYYFAMHPKGKLLRLRLPGPPKAGKHKALPDGTRPIELAPASGPETVSVLTRNTEGLMVLM